MLPAPQLLLRRRQLAALPALAAAAWGTTARAESPDDQLLVGMSMNNLLSLDPAAATGLDAVTVACNFPTRHDSGSIDDSFGGRVDVLVVADVAHPVFRSARGDASNWE